MPYAQFDEEGGGNDEPVCPTLTFQQRVIGFVVCLGFGAIMSCLSFVELFQKEYVAFGVLNTIANIFSLGSSLFLAGPKKQVKKMFEPTRAVATIVYLTTMVLTFIVALALKIGWLTVIMVIIQYLAMTWYGLSYIPFARDAVKKMIGL